MFVFLFFFFFFFNDTATTEIYTLSLHDALPIYDAFHDQVIGGSGRANADAEVELPFGREIDIDRGKELLLLVFERVEAGERTVSRIVFQPARKFLGEIVAELRVGRKRSSLVHALAVPGTVQSGIERQIPRTDFLVDDGTDFPGPGIGRESGALVTDLVG